MAQLFYVLEQPRYAQLDYAFCEMDDTAVFGDYPKCPQCGGPIGMREWLPPRQVHIKQAQRLGDLIFGAVTDMLVSEKFKMAYEQACLRGIKEFNYVEIKSIKPQKKHCEIPLVYEAVITISTAKVLFDRMDVVWESKPSADICSFCGPGRGGKTGEFASYKKIVVDPSWKCDLDIFHPINLSGIILLSQKGYDFFIKHTFDNAFMTPCSKASFSY